MKSAIIRFPVSAIRRLSTVCAAVALVAGGLLTEQPRPVAAAPGACGGLPTAGSVAAGTYTFSPQCVHTLTGTLLITGAVTIDGQGGRIEGLGGPQGSAGFTLIYVQGGDLTAKNVTVAGGGGGSSAVGGIVVDATANKLALDCVALVNNRGYAAGGLLFYSDTVTIQNSWFENNASGNWGGGLWAVYLKNGFTMRDTAFVGNTGPRGQYTSGGYNIGKADVNDNYWGTTSPVIIPNGQHGSTYPNADVYLHYNAIPHVSTTRWHANAPASACRPFLGQAIPADSTAPVITPSVAGTQGSNGWYTSNVAVSFSVSDAESDVASQSAGCTGGTVSTDTAGQTFTCEATSAGGTASQSATVKRDATPPTVGYSGNAGSYTVDQTVAITCAASDNLSGVASSTCQDVSGPAYSFATGANSRTASATDLAGNTGAGSTSFTVVVTTDSLCRLTQQFVTKPGVANSLCAKLQAAGNAQARGNQSANAGPLGAYVHEVQAQSGKALSEAQAQILIRLAQAL